jgi:hypothetical protein
VVVIHTFVWDGDWYGSLIGKVGFSGKAVLDDDVQGECKGATEREQIAPSDPG